MISFASSLQVSWVKSVWNKPPGFPNDKKGFLSFGAFSMESEKGSLGVGMGNF